MKKLLLGSTALVVGGLMAAPAMAADPIKIGVGGYYTFYRPGRQHRVVLRLRRHVHQLQGSPFTQEGEIHFIGQTKLDNGTSVGLTVELEGWNTESRPAHRRPYAPDRRSLPVRLRRLGPHRVRLARRRLLPYVLRHAVGADRLGRHPAQPLQLGERVMSWPTTRRYAVRWRPRSRRPVAGREPHQLLHARASRACRSVSATRRRSTSTRRTGGTGLPPARSRPAAFAATTTRPTSNNCPTARLRVAGRVRRRRQLPEQVR